MSRHVPHITRRVGNIKSVEVLHVCGHCVPRLVFVNAQDRLVKQYEKEMCPKCKASHQYTSYVDARREMLKRDN